MKTSHAEKIKFINRGSEIATDLLRIFGKDSPIEIADLGACDGLESIIYAYLFPRARVHAFEARKDNYDELSANIHTFALVNRIIPHLACLSNVEGAETEFWESFGDSGHKHEWDTGNKSSSILAPKQHLRDHPWCEFRRTKMLTSRFESYGISPIDFVHLDVQGAELLVLEGMGEVLKTVRVAWMEASNVESYRGQPKKDQVVKFMQGHGFRRERDTCYDNVSSGDILWLR